MKYVCMLPTPQGKSKHVPFVCAVQKENLTEGNQWLECVGESLYSSF